MNIDALTLILGFATTVVVNVAAVLIAWLSIRQRTDRIETNTNGNLAAANARADVAHETLATVVKTLATNADTTTPTP